RFGARQPITIQKSTNKIIVGHGRLEAYKHQDMKQIPVIVWYCTDQEAATYAITDNQSTMGTGWDMEALKDVLIDMDDEMLDLTGFDDVELTGILDDAVVMAEEDIPKVPVTAKSKTGEIYQLGRHRLMCGDSTVKIDVGKLMAGNKADMVFTDPPYNVAYGKLKGPKFKDHGPIIGDKQTPEEWIAFCEKVAEVIKDHSNGGIYVCHAPGPDGRVMAGTLDKNLRWSATIIWNKGSMLLGRADYQRQYEPIWYGWDKERCIGKDRTQTDVWDIDKPSSNDLHPTMKPVDIPAQAIKNSSKINARVLDLFGGSGSTLIACEQLDRICYMMEIDPKYIDVIITRWESLTDKKVQRVRERNGE
ncbi:DNA modification methylase, partial [Candidatus Pacearchaeota archaeon]|nr:DNA modification methylase [Candidatus Pacearchaeota archaeon]